MTRTVGIGGQVERRRVGSGIGLPAVEDEESIGGAGRLRLVDGIGIRVGRNGIDLETRQQGKRLFEVRVPGAHDERANRGVGWHQGEGAIVVGEAV